MKSKKIRKIIIANREIGKIKFIPDDSCIDTVKDQLFENIHRLEEIYKIRIPKFSIELIYSRKEFNKKLGKTKTPDWLIANTETNNHIIIFSPKIIKNYSSHKNIDFQKIISHELCHIFNNKISKDLPLWIDEGIALYFSGQRKLKNFKKSDWNFFVNNANRNVSFNSFVKHDGYKISYWMISDIVNNSNYDNLTSLLKNPSSLLKEGSLC